jgi:hypothetical protein
MSEILIPNQGILFMKIGIHARENLESIIDRKIREIEEAGFALWGYGGGTCHPTTMVQPFAKNEFAKGNKVYLCMQEMKSNHFAEPVRAEQYSVDGTGWLPVPKQINVLGSRYALAIKALHREEFVLPLDRTRVAVGKSRGREGNRYIGGRVDKACLECQDGIDIPAGPNDPIAKINLVAELCEPFAVFLKN